MNQFVLNTPSIGPNNYGRPQCTQSSKQRTICPRAKWSWVLHSSTDDDHCCKCPTPPSPPRPHAPTLQFISLHDKQFHSRAIGKQTTKHSVSQSDTTKYRSQTILPSINQTIFENGTTVHMHAPYNWIYHCQSLSGPVEQANTAGLTGRATFQC